MNKHLKMLITILSLTGLMSCGGDGDSGIDSISITNVSPESAVANESTAFAVEVSYSLASIENGLLMIGFNYEEVDKYYMIDEYSVSRGSGTHTFNVTVTPVDWGIDGSFEVYVNVSENPHPSPWTPLANDFRVISVTQPAPAVFRSTGMTYQCDDNACYE